MVNPQHVPPLIQGNGSGGRLSNHRFVLKKAILICARIAFFFIAIEECPTVIVLVGFFQNNKGKAPGRLIL